MTLFDNRKMESKTFDVFRSVIFFLKYSGQRLVNPELWSSYYGIDTYYVWKNKNIGMNVTINGDI